MMSLMSCIYFYVKFYKYISPQGRFPEERKMKVALQREKRFLVCETKRNSEKIDFL